MCVASGARVQCRNLADGKVPSTRRSSKRWRFGRTRAPDRRLRVGRHRAASGREETAAGRVSAPGCSTNGKGRVTPIQCAPRGRGRSSGLRTSSRGADFRSMSTIVSWIESADPAAIAVMDDDRRMTYGTLLSEARRLASVLVAMHGTGRFLLIPAEKTVRFIRALIAVSVSGNVPVPVDPVAPEDVIRMIGERCREWALIDLDTQVPSSPAAKLP